jgi:cytochrome b involved in lipid metabolism
MQHNRPNDAWTAINGRVYDLSDFLNRHPGGYHAIFRSVGKDGTFVFGKY